MRSREPKEAQMLGNHSQRLGVAFEDIITKVSEYYLSKGLGYIKKRYEPYKRVGKPLSGSRFIGIHTGASGPDFEVFLRNGRSGLLEMKMRTSKYVPLAILNEKQIEELSLMDSWGYLSLICLYLNINDGGFFVIPFSEWKHTKKKSLNLEDLAKFRITSYLGTQKEIPDILGAYINDSPTGVQ